MRTMRSYEDRLENDSIVCARIRPPIQYALSRWLGAGNEKAYCGPHPWLFYRSDIEYLTGPGFLNPARLARRARSAAETEAAPLPDPRPAIIDFHRQLATRGIKLIVLPVPPKPAVHPDKFTGRIGPGRAALQNESFAGFVSALKKEGVLVADPAPALASAGQDSFLATVTVFETPEAASRRDTCKGTSMSPPCRGAFALALALPPMKVPKRSPKMSPKGSCPENGP